jgi:Aspartyl protease
VKTIHLILAPVCLLSLCVRTTANPVQPSLPADVTINQDAGCGGLLFVTLRLKDGEELPFIVDTGCPVTAFDKSLEPKLGKRLDSGRIWMQGGRQDSGRYVAPKLYLGDTRLITGTNVFTADFNWPSSLLGRPFKGILGMDCLSHYCVQLDFAAEKMRFLDPNRMNVAALRRAFPLRFSSAGQSDTNMVRPYILHTGLLGGTATDVLIDIGDNGDGDVEKGKLKGHYFIRSLNFLSKTFTKVPIQVPLRKCVWSGNTYTNVGVDPVANGSRLGLRFLARHLVTFDFPDRTMYLKQISVGPLTSEISVKLHGSFRAAAVPLLTLKQNGELPGWSKDDRGTARLGPYSQFIAESAKAKGGVYLEAFTRARVQSATINLQKKGDPTIYHYVVSRAAKDNPWKLQKAWRTDRKGRVIEEYPVP